MKLCVGSANLQGQIEPLWERFCAALFRWINKPTPPLLDTPFQLCDYSL